MFMDELYSGTNKAKVRIPLTKALGEYREVSL